MTTSTSPSLPRVGDRHGPPHLVLAGALVAATLPYLTLKVAWLAGSTTGLADPAFATAPGLRAGNAVTAGLDLVVVALAVVLAGPWARRIPAWALVAPLWIGAGLLVPTVALLGFALFTAAGADPLAPWVRPLVYGGFTAQVVLLTTLFAAHTRERWAGAWRSGGPAHPLPRTLARGAAPVLLAVGVVRLAGLTGFATVIGLLVVAGAVGGLAVTERGVGDPAVVGAWVGTGTGVGWGLYGLVNQLGGTVFSGGGATDGLIDLAQVVAAGVLGLAVLTELIERCAQASGASSWSASKQV